MNEELKITNDVEYITYTLHIPKYKNVDYKFAQSNDYLQTELIHQLQQEKDKLQNNWNELKKWLEEKGQKYKNEEEEKALPYFYVWMQMQELEQGKDE